jgi:precorrin-3B C17-methyltransferase
MLYVVGLGAAGKATQTLEATEVLEECELIVGYTAYIELIREDYPDKEFYSTPMKQEVDRCRYALQRATEGVKVAMVCSGDSGVYGMAALIYELSSDYNTEIKVIAGVTAALSGGALLGAPLGHDFCVISLSDLLTPIELIYKRLECAAIGDMVIAIYNPSSRQRADYLQKACDILLKYKDKSTVCGIASNISREGENCRVLTLSELRDCKVDMFTTVFIGNSNTRNINGKMVTPRGYRI